MAKKNEYVVQITGDISDLQKKLQEASGDAKRLSDKEVIITLEYDGNIKGFNKEFEKVAKQHPELTVQMQYDINKQTLDQEMKKLQTMEAIKLDVDTKKASDKIEAFYDELQQDLYSNKSEKQIKDKISDILKYADAIDRLGGGIKRTDVVDNIEDMLDDFDFKGNIDKMVDGFLNLEKTISHLSFADNIEDEINHTKARIEDFQDYMKSLLSKGAMDGQNGGTGNSIIDEKSLIEVSDLLKKISEDISGIRQALSSVDDNSGIPDIVKSVESLLSKLNEVHDTVSKGVTAITDEQEIRRQKELEQSIQKTTEEIERQKQAEKEKAEIKEQFVESVKSDAAGNIKGEADGFAPLKNALLEVIDLIDRKTQGFLDEETLVRSAVQNEAEMVNELVGQLELVRDVLDKISDITKGSHSGFASGLSSLLDVVRAEDFGRIKDSLHEFKDVLKEFRDEIANLQLPEDNIFIQLKELTADKKALKDMAEVIKNYKQYSSAKKKEDDDKKKQQEADTNKEAEKEAERLQEKYLEDAEALDKLIQKQKESIELFKKQNQSKGDDNGFRGYKEKLEDLDRLKSDLVEIENQIKELQNLNPFEELENGITAQEKLQKLNESLEKTTKQIKEIKAESKNLSQSSNRLAPADSNDYARELNKLSTFISKNSGASKENLSQLRAYYDLLQGMQKQGGYTNEEIDKVSSSMNNLQAEMKRTGDTGKSMWDKIRVSFKSQLAAQVAMYASLQDMIRYFRQGFDTIREIDYALVDLRKTAKMSGADLNQFYLDANESAKQYGVTTKEIVEQASSWSRLGFNTKEQATQMAELSSQFKLISPGMEMEQATDGLVSTMKAFGIEVADVEKEIMDKINIIGNTAATSNAEIVDMLTRSSAAMAEANNSLEDTIALESAAIEITRNAETTGTA